MIDPASSKTLAVIAVDGPAASGKGTLAKRLATHFGYAYLDTGALYRAVAVSARNAGADPADETSAVQAAESLPMARLEDTAFAATLRTAEAGAAASVVAAMPAVRQAILAAQRRFAESPPGGANGAVLDGRDIGTVVCPDAPHKLYITARAAIRAKRRHKELSAVAPDTRYEAVLADIEARDARDTNRAVAPLKPADDALLLDTSDLSIEEAFSAALALIGA